MKTQKGKNVTNFQFNLESAHFSLMDTGTHFIDLYKFFLNIIIFMSPIMNKQPSFQIHSKSTPIKCIGLLVSKQVFSLHFPRKVMFLILMLHNYFLAGSPPFMPERKMWNQNEDRILRFLKEQQGEKKWSVIARKMHTDFGIEGRTGKQCRERYHNHLDLSISTTAWSKQEEQTLLRMHEQVGNKWSAIAQKLVGRSDNCVKNHFYSKLRKAVRRLNKLIADNFKKEYKQIKVCSVYKILEICQDSFRNSSKYDEELIQRCQVLKKQLYSLDSYIIHPQSETVHLQQAQKIILELNQFESKQKRNKKSSKPHKQSTSTVQSCRNKQEMVDVKKETSEDYLFWILKKVCDEYMLKEQ